MIDRQAGGDRRFLERVGLGAFFFRRDVDGDDLVTALEQGFQHGFAEGLLAVNDDTHNGFSLNSSAVTVPLAGRGRLPSGIKEAEQGRPILRHTVIPVPACAGIEPWVGMLRNSSGTNSVTKAMTCRSGLSALNSSQTSCLRYEAGW